MNLLVGSKLFIISKLSFLLYQGFHYRQFHYKVLTVLITLQPFRQQALNNYLNPRLCEKYPVLKIPWKRTWTLPVFSTKSSSKLNRNEVDPTDRDTYLYDDGTEIDSVYVEEKQKQFFSTALQNQCMALLFLAGSICGILLVSLLIWFIFGNNFFNIFFKPRKITEGAFKRYIKYIGGGIIHVVTTFFQTLGKVLAIPTQKVYHPQPEHYRWPLHPVE